MKLPLSHLIKLVVGKRFPYYGFQSAKVFSIVTNAAQRQSVEAAHRHRGRTSGVVWQVTAGCGKPM